MGADVCGAKTRSGTSCRKPAKPNGRCRWHGGLSTGPLTPEGRARCMAIRWKHGRWSKASIQHSKALTQICRLAGTTDATQIHDAFSKLNSIHEESMRELELVTQYKTSNKK